MIGNKYYKIVEYCGKLIVGEMEIDKRVNDQYMLKYSFRGEDYYCLYYDLSGLHNTRNEAVIHYQEELTTKYHEKMRKLDLLRENINV